MDLIRHRKASLLIIIVLILTGVVAWSQLKKEEVKEVGEITNFEECAEAGYPVMESYPRQCRAGEWIFVEDISSDAFEDLIAPNETEVVE